MAERKYFGTDGVRGEVGEPPITPDFVLRLGNATGRMLRAAHRGAGRPTVCIGKDTRISGYLLEAALEAGLSAAGIDVVLTGPLPTPAIAYLTRALRLDAGLVISASHNPFHDNGIKFFDASGDKLSDEAEQAIEAELERGVHTVASAELGRARRLNDAVGRYVEFCKRALPAPLTLRGLRLVVDAAHGAAYQAAPAVFHELGADVVTTGCAPDGLNINRGVGAMHPEHLREQVLKHNADLGIALDGDADRLVMADRHGNLYDGDQLVFVIARHRARLDELGGGVVGTQMTNYGLEAAFARLGIPFARAKVGDRYILELLRERGWRLGGESSGHILCLDRHTTGDAIIAALEVLRALVERRESLAEATAEVVLLPQTLLNVRIERSSPWREDARVRRAVAEWEARLAGRGRVLLRPSGTEPVVRVMVEAEDAALARSGAQAIAEAVAAAVSA
ncbi:MAG: phosphoglucosamine mutase [Casimicrobiaceae bacterium]|nr:phosphoglucosamine mutase [Casimicrobiaceae bacterium]MCX8099118.1 phosphoglucosamine mutase [Casimicrobiaceae bacterium]MDW8312185.1 phosphoglucosamine mutase [Burkholderiales bacterium]